MVFITVGKYKDRPKRWIKEKTDKEWGSEIWRIAKSLQQFQWMSKEVQTIPTEQ